jgi:peptide/nickel transport system substrate-binding protein
VADSHRQPRRRLPRFVAVAAALGLALGAFAGIATASTPDRVTKGGGGGGGELTFGIEAETTNYCLPRAQLAISGIQVVAAIYDTLTVPNAKGEAVPYLAESVEPNADSTQWTIKLREGVVFHDGTPLDSAALKLNLDSYRGAEGAPNSGPLLTLTFRFVSDVQVVDDLSVNVTLSTPVPDFPNYLFSVGRLGIVAPAQLNSGEACATNMIGTGPFKLDEGGYKQNESTTVVKNEDYWQKGFPKADQITFVPVVDGAVRVNQLQGGQLDVMHTSGALQIDALRQLGGQVELLEQQPGLREIRYYVLLAKTTPFDSQTARDAFQTALDKNKINSIRNKDIFDVANGLMDVKSPGYVKNAGYPKFNLKKAKQLVAQYEEESGGSFDIILGTTTDPDNSAEAQLMKEELGKAGINAEIAQFDQATLINQALAGSIDVLLWRNLHGGYTNANDSDTYVWFANANTGDILNFSGFNDDTTMGLLDTGRGESEIADIKKTYQDFNKAMAEGAYLYPAWYVDWTIGYQSDVDLNLPKLPEGGKPLFVYGRIPVLGLSGGG